MGEIAHMVSPAGLGESRQARQCIQHLLGLRREQGRQRSLFILRATLADKKTRKAQDTRNTTEKPERDHDGTSLAAARREGPRPFVHRTHPSFSLKPASELSLW